jgi:hypothetical protein
MAARAIRLAAQRTGTMTSIVPFSAAVPGDKP